MPNLTPEAMDAILTKMDAAVLKVDRSQKSIVRLHGAEVGLLTQYEAARNFMMELLKVESCGGRREQLRLIFGGDCTRVAQVRATVESVEFSEMYAEDQRIATCLRACDSVDNVLTDLGCHLALNQAKEIQKDALKRRRSSVLLAGDSGGLEALRQLAEKAEAAKQAAAAATGQPDGGVPDGAASPKKEAEGLPDPADARKGEAGREEASQAELAQVEEARAEEAPQDAPPSEEPAQVVKEAQEGPTASEAPQEAQAPEAQASPAAAEQPQEREVAKEEEEATTSEAPRDAEAPEVPEAPAAAEEKEVKEDGGEEATTSEAPKEAEAPEAPATPTAAEEPEENEVAPSSVPEAQETGAEPDSTDALRACTEVEPEPAQAPAAQEGSGVEAAPVAAAGAAPAAAAAKGAPRRKGPPKVARTRPVIDETLVAKILAAPTFADLDTLEPNRQEKAMSWMVWMVHRAHLDDPTLTRLDFTNMRMPTAKEEPRIAPKLVRAMSTNTHISVLLLPNSNLQGPEGVVLAEALKSNKKLKELNVDSNFLSGRDLEQLGESAGQCSTLEQVRCNNQHTGLAPRIAVEAFINAAKANTSLLKIGLSSADPGAGHELNQAIMHNTELARMRRKEAAEKARTAARAKAKA